MKTAIRIMAAGLAASLALVSCAKQEAMDNGSTSPAGGARTIAVSFANASVKSELNGLQPKFVATDVIKVSNGTDAPVDCTVEIDGSGNASITTELTGALTMVYPAAAAKMNGNAIEGVLVPTVQDGTFASANICKAIIAEKATSASFENQTAVFCITPGAGASTKYVELITAGAEIANSVPAGSEYDTMHKIHVASASAAPVYVSILVPEGLKIRDLSFADGSNMKTLKDDTDAIAVNSLYTVTNENWSRPYVEINGLKWATMNIGATSSTDAGKYFAWGDVTGQTPSGSTFSTPFKWAHAPFNNGRSIYNASYFESVKDTECPNGILALKNDAANVNWGGSWRMPTKAEFDALVSETKVWDSTNKGYTFGTSPNTIFLPAAGYGNDTVLVFAGDFGNYWSSSLYTDNPKSAYNLYFLSTGVASTGSNERCLGQSVRALSE